MSVKQHLVTAEAFYEMPEPPDKRLELVDGVVREKPLMGVQAGIAKGNLLTTLGRFVKQHDVGLVLPGLGCVLRRNPDTVRAVGICFISWEHVPEGELPDWFWEGPPTIAAEVVSFQDLAADVYDRVQDYLDAGTRQVWVLWPDRSAVSVYHPNADTRELDSEAQLGGDDVLSGFTVQVGDLFEIR